MEIIDVPVECIEVGDYNLRGSINPDNADIAALAQSIREDGLLHPLLAVHEGDVYSLVVGHRRFYAIKHHLADCMPTVAVKLIPRDEANHIKMTRKAVAENVLRRNLNPIAVAHKLKELREAGLSNKEIADDFLGFKNAGSVTACLKLLDLHPEVQQAVWDGNLSFGYAKALLPLKKQPERQLSAFREIMALPDESRNVRRAEAIVGRIQDGDWFQVKLDLPPSAILQESKKDHRLVVRFRTINEMRSALEYILERNIDPTVVFVRGNSGEPMTRYDDLPDGSELSQQGKLETEIEDQTANDDEEDQRSA